MRFLALTHKIYENVSPYSFVNQPIVLTSHLKIFKLSIVKNLLCIQISNGTSGIKFFTHQFSYI